jgi:hypothetical protein
MKEVESKSDAPQRKREKCLISPIKHYKKKIHGY